LLVFSELVSWSQTLFRLLPATQREGKGLEHCHTSSDSGFHQKFMKEIEVKQYE